MKGDELKMQEITFINLEKIRPNPFQPRETFDKEKIIELADSIKENGLLQPLLLRLSGETYQIIAGERRWRASQFAELKEVPCIVIEADDIKTMELSLIENWHRMNLVSNESEKFITYLYEQGQKAGRYESLRDMQNKTGIPESTLRGIVSGHEDRVKLAVGDQVTYTDINNTKPLEQNPKLRKEVLKLREKGDIKSVEVRGFSKAVKDSSPPVREALLQKSITVEEAEIIENELTDSREKERVLRYIESERSSDRVAFHVEFIKKVDEHKEIEAGYVETATGDIWICPICNQKYRLIHIEPTQKHRFEEVEE